MLDLSRKEALSVREKTFHSYGVFRMSGGAFYKHLTPCGRSLTEFKCASNVCKKFLERKHRAMLKHCTS